MCADGVFGVSATVWIFYPGALRELAATLATAFNIDGFLIESEEYEPFDEVGHAQALGFEAWLRESHEEGKGWFSLELSTDHSIDEIRNDRMHDVSKWLARYVGDTCKLQVIIASEACG